MNKIEKTAKIVARAKLSSTAANYLIALLFIVISVMGGFIYKLATKPPPEIKDSNALKYLNNDLSQTKDDLLEARKEIDELQTRFDKCNCK